jgi:hypothetical protein
LSFFSSPGTYGLDRYVVKRYVEQVLAQSERWKQLSPYFSNASPTLRAYSLTPCEVELMQKVLDFHLNDTLHIRISTANDQLIEYDDLLDFIRRVQDYSRSNSNCSNNARPNTGKKTGVPSLPSIHSSYVLPPSAKSIMPSLSSKTGPVKPILAKPLAPPVITTPPVQSNKNSSSTATMNGHNTLQSSSDSSSRSTSNVQVKPNLISPPGIN